MQPNRNKWQLFYPLFLMLLCGCLIPPDGPVGPEPEHDPAVRIQIAQSLQGAEKRDCETAYNFWRAGADYVMGDNFQFGNAGELYDHINRSVDDIDWPKGKYPKFTEAMESVCDPLLGDPNSTVLDKRSEIARLFHSIALGAKDAAK